MGSRLRVVSLVALGLAVAAPALADPTAAEKETARNLMDEGHALRDDKKDPKDALERFRAADQIMHVPITGYEVAATQVQLGRLVEARETLAHVLATPAKKGEPPPFRQARAKAQQLDDSLAARIPTLVITIHGPAQGATVTIDGAAVPASLIGLPSRANPGHHAITVATATMQGHAEIDLGEGDKKEVAVELAPKPVEHEAVATPEPPPKPPPEHHGARTAGLVLLGVGAAGLVAGGVTGVLTFTTQSDLQTKCPNHVCGPASHDELTMANTLATVSTVSFIAGGVLEAIGLVTFLVGKPKAAPQTGLRVVPFFGPGSAGLRGTF
jgi:hypothetical protein